MWVIIIASAVVWSIVIGWIQWLKFQGFGYNGLDLAIYHQAVWSLAHGHGFTSSIHDPSYLGDHLELWLIPLAGLYKLLPSALTLLWVQTFIVAASVIPLTLLARRYLSRRLTLVVIALFLVHPLLVNISLYEFHGLIVALPLTLWSIVAYERRAWRTWLILLLLLVAVREDVPLLVLGWATLAAIDRRGWRWWLPAATIGLIWFITAQKIIGLHNFTPGYKFLAFYQWLGSSYGEMATFPFRHPLVFLSHVFSLRNWTTVLGLVAGFGFLPLFRPRYLWPLILVFANLLVLQGEPISFLHLHYTIPFVPFLLWASFAAVRDLQAKKIWPRWEQAVVVPLLGISAVLGPLYSHLLYGQAELPWHRWSDTALSPTPVLQAALGHIKPSDRVIATFNVLPNLANRPAVYSLNYVYLGRRQYSETPYTVPTPIDVAIIDWQQLEHYQFLYRTTEFSGQTGSQRIRELLQINGLQAVWWHDSVVVYRRDTRGGFVLTENTRGSGETEHRAGPITMSGGALIGTSATSNISSELKEFSVAQYWRVDKLPTQPLFIRFSLRQNQTTVWTSTRLLGQGGFPAEEWPMNTYWSTLNQFSVPASLTGSFKLSAAILNLSGQYRLDRWRQFLPFITKQTILGSIDLGQVRL